ncbi:hypothetical protein NGA_0728900 [Nannochloropsis gaditana CCMP526]|nr:hypothetical protein NGA_0728900 [Nannochloropsis gaditana CCMP526]EKU23270.1 hypothetical protein NGA_0728900 [Nannochloropsis gaditana CCMP526]|eukprot:XP_005852563.1 hypothetical protein NGA_0728900 [Nannochloropsis gaditana CCMP526]
MEDLAAQEEETGERQRDRISPHPASYTTRRGGKEGKGREEQEIPGGKDEDILAVVPPNTPEGTVHRTSVASQLVGILLFPFVLLGGATGRLSEALSSSPSRLSTLAASSAPSEEEGEEGVDIPPPSLQ